MGGLYYAERAFKRQACRKTAWQQAEASVQRAGKNAWDHRVRVSIQDSNDKVHGASSNPNIVYAGICLWLSLGQLQLRLDSATLKVTVLCADNLLVSKPSEPPAIKVTALLNRKQWVLPAYSAAVCSFSFADLSNESSIGLHSTRGDVKISKTAGWLKTLLLIPGHCIHVSTKLPLLLSWVYPFQIVLMDSFDGGETRLSSRNGTQEWLVVSKMSWACSSRVWRLQAESLGLICYFLALFDKYRNCTVLPWGFAQFQVIAKISITFLWPNLLSMWLTSFGSTLQNTFSFLRSSAQLYVSPILPPIFHTYDH